MHLFCLSFEVSSKLLDFLIVLKPHVELISESEGDINGEVLMLGEHCLKLFARRVDISLISLDDIEALMVGPYHSLLCSIIIWLL
jgi:hypothetical protein